MASSVGCGTDWVGGRKMDYGVVGKIEDSRAAGIYLSRLTVSTWSFWASDIAAYSMDSLN